ncbi:sigma E protease regulator RseP [Thalassotalea piscium]|uniref:Zinc metalloprotease n=1 Tax=Thalassotalea piscium TaxID=1230533 RepID=A0A7X0NIB0_9GAMM|nr:sigma E protease regulator RseP [Thalassotalea piscium]MBB6543911.1 regulator of sigma E protease [Thalassotalea piscium]
MFDFLWNLSSFIIALGILITVHEYGHFWVARKNDVKVERFSIGFGKALWRKKDKQGTEFVIALIPLGGYVKMLDERVDEVADEDKLRTFNSKSVYQRIAIVAAGPIANFLFAIAAFYLMFILGMPSVKPIIGEIKVDSIAAQSQLSANSEIIEISGQSTLDWTDVNLALASQIGKQQVSITVKENGSATPKSYLLDTKNWRFEPDKEPAYEGLGIKPYLTKQLNELALVGKNSPAEKYGLKVGDQFVAINGKAERNDWEYFSTEIKKYPSQELTLTVKRSSQTLNIKVIPDSVERNGALIGYLGVAAKSEPYPEKYLIEIGYGPIEAVGKSIEKTWSLIGLSFDMIGKLITGDVSVKNLSGPIGIAQGAGDHAGYGFVYFLGFLALISINLGIINILPVPVLDGGHLVYYLIELVTGKPVSEKTQEIGFKFGTLALLGLMSIALFNDFSRL